jgi:hypothetical protein
LAASQEAEWHRTRVPSCLMLVAERQAHRIIAPYRPNLEQDAVSEQDRRAAGEKKR